MVTQHFSMNDLPSLVATSRGFHCKLAKFNLISSCLLFKCSPSPAPSCCQVALKEKTVLVVRVVGVYLSPKGDNRLFTAVFTWMWIQSFSLVCLLSYAGGLALVLPVYLHGIVSTIHLWARFSPSHPPSGLILNSYREFIILKGKLSVGVNPAHLPPRPATLLALCGRGHMAQGIFSCLANSSPVCGIIHRGKTSLIQLKVCPGLMS